MYNTADSIPRADISTVLMEAMGQEGMFIAQEVLPIFPSSTEVGRYPIFPKKEGAILDPGKGFAGSTKRQIGGTYNEMDRKFTWGSYQTEEYGLEERVDDVVARRMESFFDAEMVTGKFLMNALMLDYEMEVAALINDPVAFTATAATNAYIEANIATVDVPKDLNMCIERMTLLGEPPMEAVMSLSVWNFIRRTTKMQTYVYGFLNVTQGGSQITPDMFAAAFGLQRLLISKKSVNSAIKGKTPTLVPVWGNTYISLLKAGEGDFMNGGVGRTIVWDADSPGGLFTSESYRDEKRRGNQLRVRSNRTLKTLLPDACQLVVTGYTGS